MCDPAAYLSLYCPAQQWRQGGTVTGHRAQQRGPECSQRPHQLQIESYSSMRACYRAQASSAGALTACCCCFPAEPSQQAKGPRCWRGLWQLRRCSSSTSGQASSRCSGWGDGACSQPEHDPPAGHHESAHAGRQHARCDKLEHGLPARMFTTQFQRCMRVVATCIQSAGRVSCCGFHAT